MTARISDKWTVDGDLNCESCEHYFIVFCGERTVIKGEDDGCNKDRLEVYDGGNCRYWKKKP